MEKVRFGVLGCGFIGKVHMTQITGAGSDAELVAVYDPIASLAKEAKEKFNAKYYFDNAAELLKCSEVDAVIIASPNKTHAELAVMAFDSGKHVIVEKPLSLCGADAHRIVKAAKKAGTISMVPHQMRWSPAAAQTKALIDDGQFGKVYYAKAQWLRQCGIPGWGSWFTRFQESGGGPLIDIGVHMLDLTMYLAGSGAKPVSVFGSTFAEFGPRRQGLGKWGTPDWQGFCDVEDLATALIKLDNGATISLEVSWAANINEADSAPSMTLFGSEGGVKFNTGSAESLTLTGMKFGQSFTFESKVSGKPARDLMLRHFIDCAKAGKPTIAPVYSGMLNNLILDAIYESAKTGKSVEIDWNKYA